MVDPAGLALLHVVTAGLVVLNKLQALMPFDSDRLTGLNLCYYLF